MINALLLNGELNYLTSLQKRINQSCPQIQICGLDSTMYNLLDLIKEKKPKLIFIEKGDCKTTCLKVLTQVSSLDVETILISDEKEFAFDAIPFKIGGYLLKPINERALMKAVEKACFQIQLKKAYNVNEKLIDEKTSSLKPQLIGIPTIEGYEFLVIEEIIRCEGLQKCTRVITNDRTDIISSYNIGEFRKKLEPFGFFSPHKSHLINLGKVRKYHKEGTIILIDQSSVPVSRRRKTDFLNCVNHL